MLLHGTSTAGIPGLDERDAAFIATPAELGA